MLGQLDDSAARLVSGDHYAQSRVDERCRADVDRDVAGRRQKIEVSKGVLDGRELELPIEPDACRVSEPHVRRPSVTEATQRFEPDDPAARHRDDRLVHDRRAAVRQDLFGRPTDDRMRSRFGPSGGGVVLEILLDLGSQRRLPRAPSKVDHRDRQPHRRKGKDHRSENPALARDRPEPAGRTASGRDHGDHDHEAADDAGFPAMRVRSPHTTACHLGESSHCG